MAEALSAEKAGAADLAARFGEKATLPDPTTVRDLVTRFKAAPDGFLKLREGSTRKNWAPWLDRIVDEFGALPVVALGAKGVRRDIIAWRNRWAHQPRTADYGIQVIRRLFGWSMENELAEANPAAEIKGLYSANRADVIVEPEELALICSRTTPAGGLAFRLAAATGMRKGDLIDLRWSEVDDFSIERAANKSTTGRRLLVPLTAEARKVIAELRTANKARKVPSTHVLVSNKGPWSEGGLGTTWDRAAHPRGEDGKPSGQQIDKHFNDLRGTAVTGFCKVPLTDEEIADIMAWEPARIRAIRKRYVDRARIAQGIVARIQKAEGR
jgi:integrase